MKRKLQRLKRVEKLRGRVRDAALAKAQRADAELRENVAKQRACLDKINTLAVDTQESVDSIAWAYAQLKRLQREAVQLDARASALRKQYQTRQFELERSRRSRENAQEEFQQVIACQEAAQLDEWASFQHARRRREGSM